MSDLSRDRLQEDIAEAFCSLERRKGLAILSTGFGKMKLAFLIIEKLKANKVLFIVDSTNNRDITIKREFIKWGMQTYLDKSEFVTYQLAYKWKKEEKNLDGYLIIADEVDFAYTEKYGRFFTEYKDVDTFAMTGFMPEHKFKAFKDILPVIVHIPSEQMQEAGLLNKTEMVFIQYNLSEEKDREVLYKKQGEEMSFMQSENDAYLYLIKKEGIINADLTAAIKTNVLEVVKLLEKALNEGIPRDRAKLLYSLNSSIEVVNRVIDVIAKSDPSAKVITFSERTIQADKISKNSYHGKKTEEENTKIFDDFTNGKINIMSTCSKVNRGINIENLKYAIFESFNRNSTALRQRNGRLMRLNPDEVGTIYILMPYYVKNNMSIPTRAVEWGRVIWAELKGVQVEVLNFTNYRIKK